MPSNKSIKIFENAISKQKKFSKDSSADSFENIDESFKHKITKDRNRMPDDLAAILQSPEGRQLISDLESERNLREWFAKGIFWFLVGWSGLLFVVLFTNRWL